MKIAPSHGMAAQTQDTVESSIFTATPIMVSMIPKASSVVVVLVIVSFLLVGQWMAGKLTTCVTCMCAPTVWALFMWVFVIGFVVVRVG